MEGNAEDGRAAPGAEDLFLGRWELVPELSLYELGTQPEGGTYTIASRDHVVEVRIRWRMPGEEQDRETSFSAPADGTPQSLAAPGGPDAFTLTRVDRRTLDSAAFREGRAMAYARRVASTDGDLLAVVQEGWSADGARFRNFQVYRRSGRA
jgi:hypothetical protein